MLSGAGGLLSRCTLTGGSHRTIDPLCLENPRPAGAEPALTENVASPFQAEPRHDLVPGRTAHASLLRILSIRRDEERAKEKLGTLLKFSRRDSVYLPVLPDDPEDVVGNVISFEGICQIRSTDLFLARRIASLSVVGWRIFTSFTRTVLARANPREVELRMAVET